MATTTTSSTQRIRVVNILAFSYKNGVPAKALLPDAVVVDCRVLPNVWQQKDLRGIDGKDSRVIDWLFKKSPLQVRVHGGTIGSLLNVRIWTGRVPPGSGHERCAQVRSQLSLLWLCTRETPKCGHGGGILQTTHG